nr:MAG TPA: hypothetical protein [Caudoviricetes sp.]DAS70573.1 MAG TPA: hypothetical protein [Caudoviricetes sp.]
MKPCALGVAINAAGLGLQLRLSSQMTNTYKNL